MSADVFVIHGSEIDDPGERPADAWYIVACYDHDITTDDIHSGPYLTHAEAYRALASGDYLYEGRPT